MAVFPLAPWCMLRKPDLTLVGSIVLYFAARAFGWNLAAFPSGYWYFNPFTWQLLFMFGAWFALVARRGPAHQRLVRIGGNSAGADSDQQIGQDGVSWKGPAIAATKQSHSGAQFHPLRRANGEHSGDPRVPRSNRRLCAHFGHTAIAIPDLEAANKRHGGRLTTLSRASTTFALPSA
jgi:hypothetical protein